MQIPKDEIPDADEIRQLALTNLPSHYRLIDVRCSYGTEWPDVLPEDFEITIEYENHLDDVSKSSMREIETFQNWAHALAQDIRGDWPPESLRIGFQERLPNEKNAKGSSPEN
jgi:hypothetical protein